MTTRPGGFTLVEVVLSMGLVAMAVLTIAALLPAMFKTQQIVRLQTYAATHAMTISNAVAQGNPRFPGFTAAVTPNSDVSTFSLERVGKSHSFARMQLPGGAFSRPSFADVEQIITGNGKRYATGQTGIPIPPEIAGRIDSENDEIKALLSDGGYLFYPPPGSFSGFIPGEGVFNNDKNIVAGTTETDADRQRLVFAVIGKPQQNLLPCHPCFNLPIYKLYPFPPEVRTFPMTWIYYTKGLGSELNKWPFGLSTVQTPNPRKIQDPNPKLEVIGTICNIWKYFKDQPQPSNPASFDGAWLKIWADTYADYLALCCYGWTPISFKLSAPKPTIEVYYGPEWPSIPGGSASAAPINAPVTESDFNKSPKNYDKYVEELKSGKIIPFGSRMTEPSVLNISPAPERYYDPAQAHQLDPNDPAVVTTPTDTWYSLMAPFDPVDFFPYDGSVMPFKKGLGINTDRYREPPGLPSLEMRRYYRRMALYLWMKTIGIDALGGYAGWTQGMSSNVFETGISSDKNPLISLIQPKLDLNLAPIQSKDDLCGGENWRYPHPARIYALTFLAHAAMLVTGARGPMIKADGGYDPYKIGAANKVTDGDPMEIWDLTTANSVWGMNSATMAWWYCDLNQNHPGLGNATSPAVFDDEAAAKRSDNQKFFDGAELLQEDIQFARMAHENCMRWIMAYASENPNDLCCPRPANRQSFMDRPLWCADLFPGGSANRGGSAAPYFTMDENYYRLMSDRESRLASIFIGKVPIIVPNSPTPPLAPSWDAFHRAVDPKWSRTGISSQLGAVGSFHRSTESGHDAGKPWLLNAADTANGVHFNRPFAASERCRELVFWSVDWMNYEDAESAPSAPFDASFFLSLKNDGALGSGAFDGAMYGTPEDAIKFLNPDHTFLGSSAYSSAYGQYGADRNGSGRFDRGSIPSSQRMRATTIARFNLYDPVGPCGIRQ